MSSSLNINLLKQYYTTVCEDQSLFKNFIEISKKYNKLLKKYKDKNSSIINNCERLREEIKKWLFNQPLENRIKICTVENEFYCKIIYQMYQNTNKKDKHIKFQPSVNFIYDENDTTESFTKIDNTNNNNNIKITKTNKKGQKIEANKIGLTENNDIISAMKLNNNSMKDEFPFNKYFRFQTDTDYNILDFEDNNNNINNIITDSDRENFINDIIIFSIHHKNYPDSFTLSPNFLLDKTKFENCFVRLGNKKYFTSLIDSKINNNNNSKLYWYAFPDWFDDNNYYNLCQYVIMFIEQVILIKFVLNYENKKNYNFSLINEENMSRFFSERKMAIEYMNKNYNIETRINILQELNTEKIYSNIINNNTKMNYITYYKTINKEILCRNINIYIDPITSINSNQYKNKYENMYMKNNHKKNKNSMKNNNNNNTELNLEDLNKKLTELIVSKSNVEFIDSLIFQYLQNIWKIEYFFQMDVFEKLINLITDQNCKELIFESKKKSHKNKKNNKKRNNDNISTTESDSTKANSIKINGENESKILKDENEELYAPYYLKYYHVNQFVINKDNSKEVKNKMNEEQKEKQIIENYIGKNLILGEILEEVFQKSLDKSLNNCNKYDLKENESKNIISENTKNTNNYINEVEKNEENINKSHEMINMNKIIVSNNIINNNENKNNIINITSEKNIINENNNDINNINENINTHNISENNKNNISIKSKINDGNANNDINTNKNVHEIKNEINNIKVKDDNNDKITDRNNLINIDNIEIQKSPKYKETIVNENSNKCNPNINNINESINIKLITPINKTNDNNNPDSSNSNHKKKKEKEQTFFLFDTVKKKKNKKHLTTSNLLISNEFSSISLKDSGRRLTFIEKLHNDIIKNESKVISILNHVMIFKDFCIEEIKRIINETFTFSKDYIVETYGSYATGLMIEASDIDIKIRLNNAVDFDNIFNTLCKKLEEEKKFDNINPIQTASVPVIKLLLNPEKFIIGKEDLEKKFKQFKEMSLYKNYVFDNNELKNIKIDITFIFNDISNEKITNSELSSVSYVKEQILKYPEVKFVLRVLKRYFYNKKMNTSFLGGLSSYNLFLLLLSYAIFYRKNPNLQTINLGEFLIAFLECFKNFNFKECIIDVGAKVIPYNDDDYPYGFLEIDDERSKEYRYGKSIVIIDPLSGLNASRSSYKIDDIHNTFLNASDFFKNEKFEYEKAGLNKKHVNGHGNDDNIVMGINNKNQNKNSDNNFGGNIIDKFLGKIY